MKNLIRKILKEHNQEEIDRILDKINEKGIDSLTSKEKKVLSNIDNEEDVEEEEDGDDLSGTFKELEKVFKTMESQKLTYNSSRELLQKIKDVIKNIYHYTISDIENSIQIGELKLNNMDDVYKQHEFFNNEVGYYLDELKFEGHLKNLNQNEMNDLIKYLDNFSLKLWNNLKSMCDMCGN
jgi:hypothetical protein